MKNKIVWVLFFLVLCSDFEQALSQPSQVSENFMKYWYYRFRFKNNFVVIGDCQGCSQPFPERHYGSPNSGEMYVGDGGINVGTYMMILATEYKQLRSSNQPTQKTEEELYYLLLNFERNDMIADSLYTGQMGQNNINGFFLRDVVPPQFSQPVYSGNQQVNYVYERLNKHNTDGLIINTPNSQPVSFHHSDFRISTGDPTDPEYPNVQMPNPSDNLTSYSQIAEMSQDQAIRILGGLYAIVKFVDSQTIYPFRSFTMPNASLKNKAIEMAGNIVSYIRGHWYSSNPLSWWRIRNPAAPYDVVHKGQNSTAYSYPLARAGDLITGSMFTYQDAWSLVAGFNLWFGTTLVAVPIPIPAFDNSEPLTELLMAMSGPLQAFTPSPQTLSFRSSLMNYEWISLYAKLIYGYNYFPWILNNHIEQNRLDNAPCQGPYNYKDQQIPGNLIDYTPDPYAGTSLVDSPLRRHGDGGFSGEYPGMDYMLYYNLYASTHSYNSSYFDMIDRNITVNFPFSSLHIGSEINPYTAIAFSTITASNQILAGNTSPNIGEVTYRAGEEIALLPGFDVEQGATFAAYIDPINICTHNYRTINGADPTNQIPLTFDESKGPYVIADNGQTNSDIMQAAQQAEEIRIQRNNGKTEVFPNPCSSIGNLTIRYTSIGPEILHYQLSDMTGNQIEKQSLNLEKGDNTFKFKTSELSPGAYLLTVTTDQKTETIKIIIE